MWGFKFWNLIFTSLLLLMVHWHLEIVCSSNLDKAGTSSLWKCKTVFILREAFMVLKLFMLLMTPSSTPAIRRCTLSLLILIELAANVFSCPLNLKMQNCFHFERCLKLTFMKLFIKLMSPSSTLALRRYTLSLLILIELAAYIYFTPPLCHLPFWRVNTSQMNSNNQENCFQCNARIPRPYFDPPSTPSFI